MRLRHRRALSAAHSGLFLAPAQSLKAGLRRGLLPACLAALCALPACAGTLEQGGAAQAGAGHLVGTYVWKNSHDRFGGFSGLEVSEDGQSFTAISDRGSIVMGQFQRENGVITGLEATPVEKLLDETGTRMNPEIDDAEGLAIGPGGRIYVSFEGPPRIHASERFDLPATVLPQGDFYPDLQNNSGLEALAIDAEGRLLTLPERSGQLTKPFPVWRFDGKNWSQPFSLPRSGTFLAVGADIGPDGKFYLLEREFTGYAFRSRVRRFDITGDKVRHEEVLFESGAFEFDNLEGLAVWRSAPGRIRLTMISDDNFKFFQKTEFVEVDVPESLDPQAMNQ
ncbi:esterase-like activity of phytase family protein [Salipiger sp. CCB-MM3]|uniref:esterase-like activity of phytase family protein n=1 Tax=Salipiger sp. CCB-MM3 TaxID=1792508 RepID=UPI0009F6030A|nr:esterase-like activity of phytase family protein [Salipiger sp. CCB-MM3]